VSASALSSWYSVAPGPWGPIHLAACGESIVAIELMTSTPSFVASLERRLQRPVSAAVDPSAITPTATRDLLERARAELAAYLAGERRTFDLPIELVGLSVWDRLVLEGVRGIPYGSVTSYGRLARLIGRPGAARAVGGAVGRNPIGLVIPCHRVIAGDGGLGGYGGDWYETRQELLTIKRGLLGLEGIGIPARDFVG
jgi:methylated-DNA-[protein]-cysteine S-methyltransferase